jgi:hypothetical protein
MDTFQNQTPTTPMQPIPKPRSASMPFSRANRRRQYAAAAASTPQNHNQIEVQGEAYLCFSEDYATFQGNINTNDESNYSIMGESVTPIKASNPFPGIRSPLATKLNSMESTPNESEDDDEEFNNNSNIFRLCRQSSSASASSITADNQEEPTNLYNVTVTDHYTGLTYRLSNISLNTGRMPNFHVSSLLRSTTASKGSTENGNGMIFFRVESLYKGQKADMMIKQHIGSTLLGQKCTVYSGMIDVIVNEDLGWGKSWSL